jgi:GH25 family lysozyme M1 (1,4-beta-N-acetylmuramidase)
VCVHVFVCVCVCVVSAITVSFQECSDVNIHFDPLSLGDIKSMVCLSSLTYTNTYKHTHTHTNFKQTHRRAHLNGLSLGGRK